MSNPPSLALTVDDLLAIRAHLGLSLTSPVHDLHDSIDRTLARQRAEPRYPRAATVVCTACGFTFTCQTDGDMSRRLAAHRAFHCPTPSPSR